MNKFITPFLEYLFLFLLLIEFNTPYTYFPAVRKIVYAMLSVVLFGLLLSRYKKIKIDFFVIALLIGSLLPALNVASGHFTQYIRIYIITLPMLVLYITALFKNGKDKVFSFLIKYSNIVVGLAIVSLFFWMFGSLLEKISYTMLIPNSWTGVERLIPTYYGIYFETQDVMATAGQTSKMIRNSGIFNEAPMHNMILCTAVAIETFIRPYLSKPRILILVITVCSTISTTGFIFLTLLFAGKLYLIINGRMKSLFVLGLPLICLFAFFSISMLLENKRETGEGSYNSRSHDIARCIEVGLENPILGVELFHRSSEKSASKANGYGYSNSLFAVFAHGGLYVWSFYFMSLFVIPFLCYRKTKDVDIFGLMLCYFLLFTFTVSQYKYLTMLFMAIGLSYWNVTFQYRKKQSSTSDISKV